MGFDAGPVLGWAAATTRRVTLGTHVLSVYARDAGHHRRPGGLARHPVRRALPPRPGDVGSAGGRRMARRAFDQPIDRTRDDHRDRARRRSAASGSTTPPRSAFRGPGVSGGRSASANWTSRSTFPCTSRQWDPGTKRSPPSWPSAGHRRRTPPMPMPASPPTSSPRWRRTVVAATCSSHRSVRWRSATTFPRSSGSNAAGARSTSRAWARARRTSTPTLGAAWATGRWSTRSKTAGSRATVPRHATRCRMATRTQSDCSGHRRGIRERLERYTQVGIDEIVVELRKPDLDDQLQDLRMFWDALHA